MKKKKPQKKAPSQKKLLKIISQKKFEIIILIILLISTILRFYNYQNLWSLGNDNSRDIAIAREALSRHELPLIGSFSSAGPFVFGPLFYWVVMGSYIVLPFMFTAPFFVTALSGVLTVGVLMACGYLINGKRLTIIIGILTAFAPQFVMRSLVVGQHTYIAPAASLLFLMYILYWQKKKLIFAFLAGIFLGIALSFHYQAINLLIFFAAILLVPKISWAKRILGFLIMFLGFLLPSLPLLLWDSQQHFANIRNILDYFLLGQYRIYVPNSWKLFLFTYLPSYWGFVVGGTKTAALLLIGFTFIMVIITGVKKKISLIMYVFGVMFAVLLVLNRYYRGERSEGYLIYLAPFILLFTAWSIDKLFEFTTPVLSKKILPAFAVLILVGILIANTVQILPYYKSGSTVPVVLQTINYLTEKYPNTKFAVYDYRGQSSYMSQPLGLMLNAKNKSDPKGMSIGIVYWDKTTNHKFPVITTAGYNNVDNISKVKNRNRKPGDWIEVNQQNMYDDLIGWSKKHALTSTFSLPAYIQSRFHL